MKQQESDLCVAGKAIVEGPYDSVTILSSWYSPRPPGVLVCGWTSLGRSGFVDPRSSAVEDSGRLEDRLCETNPKAVAGWRTYRAKRTQFGQGRGPGIRDLRPDPPPCPPKLVRQPNPISAGLL